MAYNEGHNFQPTVRRLQKNESYQPVETEESSKAWDQLPNESSKEYNAFLAYLELGPERTIDQARISLYGQNSGSTKTLQHYSRTHNWVDRAQAFDRHVASIRSKRLTEVKHKAEDRIAENIEEITDRLVKSAKGEIKLTREQNNSIRMALEAVGIYGKGSNNTNVYQDNRSIQVRSLPNEVQDDVKADQREVPDQQDIEKRTKDQIPDSFDDIDDAEFNEMLNSIDDEINND